MPKVEVAKVEPHLSLDAEMLPEMKKWNIGSKYRIELEVEQISLSKGNPYGSPSGEKGFEGRFKVISAKALGKAKASDKEDKDNPGPKMPLKKRLMGIKGEENKNLT